MFQFLKNKTTYLYAPVDRLQIPLEKVNDPVFSTKMMGDGVAFQMIGDTIYSPCNGIGHIVADTSHAFGITMSNGVEILLHVGLDTVHLKGEGLTPLKKQGDTIIKGTPLLQIDCELMKQKNVDLTIIMIVVETKGYCMHVMNHYQVEKGKAKVISFN